MVFTELKFLLFFFVVFSLYWLVKSKDAKKVLLLGASYYFYGSWDWRFLSLILIDTVVSYFVALGLDSSKNTKTRKLLVASNVVVCIGILFVFKYFNFFIDNLASLLSTAGIKTSIASLSLILPVGISFFTFQTLSYSIDVYRRELPANRSFLDVALFIAFFPQLVAGPIVRAIDFIPQMAVQKQWRSVRVRVAVTLILAGFFKKACVSDNIAPIVDQFFSHAPQFDSVSTLLGVFLYATQIYCDFSGYSDMAIGISELFGYRLLRNFNHPYMAYSITDFWRRWHISLSSWLRDYLYIPLGGNRGSELFCYRNLMLTMLIGGLWHGAS